MSDKKYYWLKLKDDIFSSRRIKKLRSMENGDTLFVIYLKLQLIAMKCEGLITYTGLEESFEEELALDLDEDVELVKSTLDFLLKYELAERISDTEILLPWALINTQSETADAERKRRERADKKNSCPEESGQSSEEDGQRPDNVRQNPENVRQIKIQNQSNNQTADKDIYPTNKNLFLTWCRDHDITDAAFAADFYDRYTANSWTSEDGRPIRNWQHFATAAWKKEKKNPSSNRAPADPEDTMRAIRERRERERNNTITIEDLERHLAEIGAEGYV